LFVEIAHHGPSYRHPLLWLKPFLFSFLCLGTAFEKKKQRSTNPFRDFFHHKNEEFAITYRILSRIILAVD